MRIYKEFILALILVVFILNNTSYAKFVAPDRPNNNHSISIPTDTKFNRPMTKVAIFYCVDDSILQAQTVSEDVEKGKEFFSTLLNNSFKSRCLVTGVDRIYKKADGFSTENLVTVPDDTVPLVLELSVVGMGEKEVTYYNGFGAQRKGTTPTMDILCREYMYSGGIPVNMAEERIQYSSDTAYKGNFEYGTIVVADKDERTFVMNGVMHCILSRCNFSAPNKYAMKSQYDKYVAEYYIDKDYFVNDK